MAGSTSGPCSQLWELGEHQTVTPKQEIPEQRCSQGTSGDLYSGNVLEHGGDLGLQIPKGVGFPLPQSALTPQGSRCPGQDSSHCSLGTRYRTELSSGEPSHSRRGGEASGPCWLWGWPNLFSTETELCSDDLGILCNDSNVWTWNADCAPYLSCCGERRRPSPKELA